MTRSLWQQSLVLALTHVISYSPFPMLVARLVVAPHQLKVPQHVPYFVTIGC
jgi:hypothetical protein